MSTPSYTIPTLNGDGSAFALQLNLPQAAVAGTVAWSNTTHGTGLLTPSNDGRSSLYTVVSASTDLVTATITTGSGGLNTPWTPGHLYRLNDKVIDQNGHVQQVTAATKYIPTVFTPNANSIPQGGDVTQDGNQYGGTLVSGTTQFGTVLNTDGGGANGDWPVGGLNAGGYVVQTGAAPVGFVQAGYSRGRSFAGVDGEPAGIDTPQSYSNNSTLQQIATYSETGVGGLRSYYDAAGNLHTGWVVATGTQTFTESVNQPPTFSTTGGTTTDGDLIWTDQGAAATTTSYAANITTSVGAFGPYGSFVLLG